MAVMAVPFFVPNIIVNIMYIIIQKWLHTKEAQKMLSIRFVDA